MADTLAIQPLVDRGGFNWIFLIEILICGILALFFLFYFNRLFATVLAYSIRAWTWHKYRAYIDIQALQISLLGGRIFFKSIRYHAHNVTCTVYDGHITWRYWLRMVQDAEAFQEVDPARSEKERSGSSSKSEHEGKSSGEEKEKIKARSRSIGKEEKAGGKPKKQLPCRISVKVSGVEAFVYNRSPAYDIVLEQTLNKAKSPPSSSGDGTEKEDEATSPTFSRATAKNERRRASFAEKVKTNDTFGSSIAPDRLDAEWTKPELPAFLRMFPVKIECRRAAATLGNENTTNVIIAKVERAVGAIDAGHAGPFDLYKLLFTFDLETISATMRPNRDFKQLQLDAARRLLRERETAPVEQRRFDFTFIRRLQKWWQSAAEFLSRSKKSVNGSLRTPSMSIKSGMDGAGIDGLNQAPGQGQWHGLDRYMDERELDEHDEWKDVEYGKASSLADIEKLHFRFYFDMPGKVPNGILENATIDRSNYGDDLNGCKPPDYGMDFAVYGGVVTYGPWADRQRLNLQQIFFPASYVDAVPRAPLRPGETRDWSLFKIFISIEEDLTLRIPSREPSKDKEWQGRGKKVQLSDAQDNEILKRRSKHGRKYKHPRRRKAKTGNPGIDTRPYGWLDIIVKTDTTVSYTMDMYPRPTGYENTLDVDCKSTEITSSVNHGLLWRTGPVSVVADLSQPAAWNTLRKWPFDITINDMELFILRDHMFLIIDLVNDWSYGPPVDFYTFVPYVYSLRMLFRNFIIYLNVNDANLVNDPADFDKNDFLTLEGTLDATLDINMDQYRPVRNMIRYDVLTTDMRMRMFSPPRSTFSVLVKDKVVATLPKLTLSGSYSGHMEERPGLVDALRFDIVGTGLTMKAYGFLVRQLINIKENYFGDYMHFTTLEEFQAADDDLVKANRKIASIPKPKFINELDVMLCIVAEDVTVLLPANLYSCDEFIRMECPIANLDLRIISYYLDMGLQLAPVTILSGMSTIEDDSPVDSAAETQLFIKHVNLDGHRSFGLPFDEPPYISQWDVDVGAITGDFSSSFIHHLALGARAFVFGFSDRENALMLPAPVDFFDPGFVQVRTETIRLWAHVGKDALLFAADPIEVVTNDWAGETFSQRVSVVAPKITLASVDAQSASRHRVDESGKMPVHTYAFFQTGAAVNVLIRKLHFKDERWKQQNSIRVNDMRTGRAPFLLRPGDGMPNADDDIPDFYPPTMPYPYPAPPLDGKGLPRARPASIKSIPSYVSAHQLKSKASSSSLSASLRNGSLAVPTSGHPVNSDHRGRTPTSDRSMGSSSPASSTAPATKQRRDLPDDVERARVGLPSSTIAFSSSYSTPYFPLDMIEPDETNVPHFDSASTTIDDDFDGMSSSEDIANPDASDDTAQTSVIIQLIPGIRAYVEPRIVVTVSKLLKKVLPKNPEEVLDTFQMDVLETVAAKQQARHKSNSTLELQISLPAARLRIVNPGPERETDDQADIALRSANAYVRIRDLPSASGSREVLAVHTKVEAISASLGRPESLSTKGPAAQVNVDDALVWVAVAAVQAVHATVGDAIVSVSGEQAASIMDFVIRLLPLVNELKEKVQDPIQTNRNRLLLLVHALSQQNEDIGDPAFLSGVTYILRAFPDHFRNQESWKVIARFRHVLQNMPTKALEDLKATMKMGKLDCPRDAPVKALNHWAQYQNWDVPDVRGTVAFQMLFGEEEEKAMHHPQALPLVSSVRFDYLRLAVEYGEQANEFVVEETSLAINSTPPTAPTGLMLVDENTRTKTIVQTHASMVTISFNWSVFDIVERVLPLKDKLQQLTSTTSSNQQTTTERLEDSLYRHIFQVVASTDNGSIVLQSINLRHLSRADGLKMSLVGTTQAVDEGYGPCATAIVNADNAITELHGPPGDLWKTLLTSPSIYADHVRPLAGMEAPPSTYIAVGYKTLELDLIEQVPGLLAVIDSVILDEATKVTQLIESTKASESSPSKAVELQSVPSKSASSVRFHVALLAGDLRMEASLLQTLSYQLVGTAVSMRLAPTFSKDQAWAIDFDVGQQSHRFINSSADRRHAETILDVPPINGHVGVELAPDATSLSVATTMQQVQVNAAAIQEAITTANKPEVQDVISAIKSGVMQLQNHVEDIKTTLQTPGKRVNADSRQLAFDVRFALLGIRIATAAPRTQSSSIAAVEFGIGPLHALATNKKTSADDKSLLPEVRAQIRDIGARLQIDQNGRVVPKGNFTFGLELHFKSKMDENAKISRSLRVQSHGLELNGYPDTPAIAVDVINHIQDRLRSLDLSKEIDYLKRLSDSRRQGVVQRISGKQVSTDDGAITLSAEDLLSVTTTVQLDNIKVAWIVDSSFASSHNASIADLVLTLQRIEFTTRGGHEARLAIEDLQLQLAKKNAPLMKRSLNSALMPEVTFSVGYWSVDKNRSLTFKAAGAPLEVRLESKFMFPVDALQRSITSSIDKVKSGTATWQWQKTAPTTSTPRSQLFDTKRIASILVEADFAGAQFYMEGQGSRDQNLATLAASTAQHGSQHGRYGQFAAEGAKMQTTLKAPGIAVKVEYNAGTSERQATVNGEVRVDASSNMLLPNVVPLILEVSNSVTQVMKDQEKAAAAKPQPPAEAKPAQRFFEDDSIITTTPTTIFGKMKVDLGLRVCRQEFGLTCQPIARVDAKAELDDFYFTMNTIESDQHGHFFAITAIVTKLGAQVKHMYSREPTFTYDMDSIVLSVMNSKHLSGTTGISAILKINPTRTFINGKQMQDLLLFREIWLPPEIRSASAKQRTSSSQTNDYFAQKYRDVAAAAAFPWNATVSIAKLAVDLDLGQSIGKSSFTITNLWASQAKSSNYEQNLCIGMDEMAMTSTGRMSGFIRLNKLGVRTAIKWADSEDRHVRSRTPLIQASIGFDRLLAKAAFDYQAIAFADVEGFDFLMYNVHQAHGGARDRLVAVLDCDKAYVFCTSTSPARAVGLYQAFDRFIQEKQTAFEQSLRDIEKHVRRESTIVPTRFGPSIADSPVAKREAKTTISLHTDVVLTIGTISFGVFPGTFFDSHILKLEANNIQARFAVGFERGRIASALGMTLGQLQVALADVRRITAVPRALDISVDEVVNSAVNAKGGTILRVPKVVASMQAWQSPDSNSVDYIFKSLFDGKIDVGWNLSRIDFIQGIWTSHSRSLANRLGKALPESAVKITAGPATSGDGTKAGDKAEEGERITAEVNLPLSKYEYHPLETPIIETPQLRDLGEATPSLEWVGLHKDRLPNVTHQIIVVSLLEVAKEVEDAYERILGSS